MEMGTCEFCKYWVAEDAECHCHAPQVSERTGRGMFPRTDPDDFCGDGEPNTQP